LLIVGVAIAAMAAVDSPKPSSKLIKASGNQSKTTEVLGSTMDSFPTPKNVAGATVVSSSAGDESAGDDDPYADENKQQGTSENQLVLTKDPSSGLLTIDAPGEDVRSIIRKVADLYDLNIMIPASLNGTATLKFRNVTWKQLFDVMLPPTGCGYMEDKNIVLIKSKEEISAEPTQTTVFPLNFSNATDLVTSITPLVDSSNGGKIQIDKRSNSLIVTERPSKFNGIKDIIERLDKPTPEVMIETKFIDIDDTDGKNLGLNWGSLNGYNLSAGSSSASAWTRAWTHTHNAATTVTAGTGVTASNTAPPTTWTDTAVFNAPEFSMIINALNTLSGTHLISNPTVVALNNTEATINVGEEYPVPQYTYNQQQGAFEVSGFDYKDIGVNLKVTPQINPQGYITLTVTPEVSDSDNTVTFGGSSGASIPIITTRKSSNTVCVKDGNTIAIGGLIETRKVINQNKLPLIGGLPFVGNSQNNQTEKRNLIVFITVRIISADGSDHKTIPLRQMHEMNVTPSDMSGYTVTPEEEALLKKISDQREAAGRKLEMETLSQDEKALTGKVSKPESQYDTTVLDLDSRAH